MAYRTRVFFTDKQKSDIWDRWQRGGELMSSIGRHFDRSSSSIYPLLERSGGIRPAIRRRSRLALTLCEREEISRGLVAKGVDIDRSTLAFWVGKAAHELKPVHDALLAQSRLCCRETHR